MRRQYRDHLFCEKRKIVPFILDGNDDGGPWTGCRAHAARRGLVEWSNMVTTAF